VVGIDLGKGLVEPLLSLEQLHLGIAYGGEVLLERFAIVA